MAKLICKPSVRFKGFTRGLVRILGAVLLVAEREVGMREVVITSANDGKHSRRPRSRHYTDEAVDVRSRSFRTDAMRQRFLRRLRRELGPSFWLDYEHPGKPNAHFHLQVRRGHRYVGPLCTRRVRR
jgi:hypothetical protein